MIRSHWSLVVATAIVLFSANAQAGIAECNGIRLEEAQGCEFRGEAGCAAGCEELKMNIACSAELHAECRGGCDLEVTEDCSKSCEQICTEQCDAGIEIDCSHNCFEECHGTCDTECADADDKDQCVASCEATCDGECDVRCKPLQNASCYEHCRECCHGSCRAIVNMDCQISCQAEAHAECEADLRAECDASCEVDGAIFCDGEFVASGPDIEDCAAELTKRGIAELEISGEVAASLDSEGLLDDEGNLDLEAAQGKAESGVDVGSKAGTGCSIGQPGSVQPTRPALAWALLSLLGVALFPRRRRN